MVTLAHIAVFLAINVQVSSTLKFFDARSLDSVPTSPAYPRVSSHAMLRSLSDSLATRHRQIVLSTISVSPEGPHSLLTDILRNFAQSLSASGLLQHSLLVAMDPFTAGFILEHGIPCVVDAITPHLYADLSNGVIKEGFYPNVSKWLWSQQLVQMDLSVLYLDWDVSVIKNPFDHLDTSYDIQGLSDFYDAPKHVGKLQVAFRDTGHTKTKLHPAWCPLYGDSLTPCQSTGVSYIKAGAVTQRFLEEFVTELLANTPGWWEQAAYNEFLPGWTMGTGMQAPLRYRLLPYRQYMNVGVWHELAQQSNASEELILLHGGWIGLPDKGNAFAGTGHFHPDSWDPDVGKVLVQRVLDITSADNETDRRHSLPRLY